MKQQYDNILDFALKNVSTNSWNISSMESIGGEYLIKDYKGDILGSQNINYINYKGDDIINIEYAFDQSKFKFSRENSKLYFKRENGFNNYLGNVSLSFQDLAAIAWSKVLESNTLSRLFSEKGLLLANDLIIRHFVPLKIKSNFASLVVLFHKKYFAENPMRIILNNEDKNSIISELYPDFNLKSNTAFLRKVSKMISDKSGLANFVMDKNIFSHIMMNNDFEILVNPYPELRDLSSTPKNGIGVGISLKDPTSSIGVFAQDKNGNLGFTVCYHDFFDTPAFGVGTELYIGGHLATVSSVDILSDSCFAIFNNANIFSTLLNNGPLEVSPRAGQICSFSGITSGLSEAIVTSWDPSVPYIKPKRGLINMQKVYSTPSVNPGDSGCALMDENNFVVGFAGYRTGIGSPVPFAVWIWAETVFYAHTIN